MMLCDWNLICVYDSILIIAMKMMNTSLIRKIFGRSLLGYPVPLIEDFFSLLNMKNIIYICLSMTEERSAYQNGFTSQIKLGSCSFSIVTFFSINSRTLPLTHSRRAGFLTSGVFTYGGKVVVTQH